MLQCLYKLTTVRKVNELKAAQLIPTALRHFASHGYEGASLNDIAQEVGIKKPSIYAHYSGKDDLFLKTMAYALGEQKKHLASYFVETRQLPLEASLKGFFDWFIEESNQNDQMKFILRIAYFPPVKLEHEVTALINPFFDSIHRHLARLFRERDRTEQILYSDDYTSGALAYLTVAEGTMTELVYNGIDAYQQRLTAVWPIFWRGLVR